MHPICSHLQNQLSLFLRAKAAFDDAFFIASQKNKDNKFDKATVEIAVQKHQELEKLFIDFDKNVQAPIACNCMPEEIAWGRDEINENTKAYIGPLFPNIFQTLRHLEHIYTAFPEGRIKRTTLEIGGKTEQELIKELKAKKIRVSKTTEYMINSSDFTTSKRPISVDLVRLKVRDLDMANFTTENIYRKAVELGLELCPPEVGPYYRLRYTDQPSGDWLIIGMKQIAVADRFPRVFALRRDDGSLWLRDDWAGPDSQWPSDDEFVFRLSKYEI